MKKKRIPTSSARKKQRAATPPAEGKLIRHSRPAEGTGVGSWPLQFTLNGKRVSKKVRPDQTLLDFLRIEMKLTGTKGACLEGECGSCYVLVNGRPMNSCMMLAPQVQGREVVTIEGLAHGKKLDVIQEKFVECGAVQCGYCTPGLILAAKALLSDQARPTHQEFLVGMEGNICRCTGYNKIMRACELAADSMGLKK
jgi:carbon-monoxide dehydrogenase small subunit